MRLNGTKAALAAAIGAIWAPPAAAAASLEPPPAAAATPAQPPRITTLRIDRGADSAVGYEVAFGRDGTPRTCRVTESSGSQEVDAKACTDAINRGSVGTDAATRVMIFAPGEVAVSLLNMREVFTVDDYPVAAQMEGAQGRVVARVTVSPDGRATGCSVRESSGTESLDSTTCRLLVERGRFASDPGKGAGPRASFVPVRWALPSPPTLVDSRSQLRFTVDGAGKVGSCAAIGDEQDSDGCGILRQVAERIVANNRTPAGELVLENGILIGGEDGPRAVGSGPGEVRYRLKIVPFTVAVDGSIERCGDDPEGATTASVSEPFCFLRRKRFAPLDANARDQSVRYAAHYTAAYFVPRRLDSPTRR